MFEQKKEEIYKNMKNILLKQCSICNGEGDIKQADGTYKNCECVNNAIYYSKIIYNGVPKKFINNINYNNALLTNYINNLDNVLFMCQSVYIHSDNIVEVSKAHNYLISNMMKKQLSIVYCSFDELLKTYKSNFDLITEQLNKCDVLFLNDIGMEVTRDEYGTKMLYNLLVNRYRADKLVILSSALSPINDISVKYNKSISNMINDYLLVGL